MKDLERENLRDHMTDIELILTMLAEATTTKLHRDRDTKGFVPLKKDARNGGAVTGRTRRDIEKRAGKPVVTSDNFKALTWKGSKEITEIKEPGIFNIDIIRPELIWPGKYDEDGNQVATLMVGVGELAEHFQKLTEDESRNSPADSWNNLVDGN